MGEHINGVATKLFVFVGDSQNSAILGGVTTLGATYYVLHDRLELDLKLGDIQSHAETHEKRVVDALTETIRASPKLGFGATGATGGAKAIEDAVEKLSSSAASVGLALTPESSDLLQLKLEDIRTALDRYGKHGNFIGPTTKTGMLKDLANAKIGTQTVTDFFNPPADAKESYKIDADKLRQGGARALPGAARSSSKHCWPGHPRGAQEGDREAERDPLHSGNHDCRRLRQGDRTPGRLWQIGLERYRLLLR